MRQIREAIMTEIPAIMPVIDAAREMMHASGNVNQWINGYPSEEVIQADIARDGGYASENAKPSDHHFSRKPLSETVTYK